MGLPFKVARFGVRGWFEVSVAGRAGWLTRAAIRSTIATSCGFGWADRVEAQTLDPAESRRL
jgi:hypothetical protein